MRLVFLASIAQLWLNFYLASLLGVEQHVKANALLVAAGIVRSALVILPLWVWPSPSLFLWWQLLASLGFAVVVRAALYKSLNNLGICRSGPAGDLRLVIRNWKFSGVLLLISIASAINTQIDKVFIGRLQGLEALSAYSLVTTFAQLLVFCITPITLMLVPRMVRMASSGNSKGVAELFHVVHKVVAALLSALTGLMIFFGPYLVYVWTGGNIANEKVASYLPMIVIGYFLLGLGTVPHSIAIANKNIRASLFISATVFLTVPGYWFSISQFGPQGAAATWAMLQIIVVPFYYWIVLKQSGLIKYKFSTFFTVLKPFIASILLAGTASHLLGEAGEVLRNLFVMSIATALCLSLCLFITLQSNDRALISKLFVK